jgi:hypothetical protein
MIVVCEGSAEVTSRKGVVSSRDSTAKLVANNQTRLVKRIFESEQVVMCDENSEGGDLVSARRLTMMRFSSTNTSLYIPFLRPDQGLLRER